MLRLLPFLAAADQGLSLLVFRYYPLQELETIRAVPLLPEFVTEAARHSHGHGDWLRFAWTFHPTGTK